ncbi:MAG TPA: hypothetical protein VIJ93_06485, partial [bacterium]
VQTKLAGGWFLVRDGGLRLDSSEVFGGTGVYLQGRTSALLTGNKIMGNSVGITTAGRLVRLSGFFNRIAKNSYGLYLKEWGSLDLRDNSLQDNAWEIVNLTAQPAPLAGNYWGGLGSAEVTPKCRGKGILEPLKGMEEVYLDYYKAHYPKMSEEQAKALAANWKRTNKERSADKAGTQAPAGPAAAEASTETDPSKAADLNSLDLNGIPL